MWRRIKQRKPKASVPVTTMDPSVQVVVPLGRNLGLYPARHGRVGLPQVRLKRITRDMDPHAYAVWTAASAAPKHGRLWAIDELAEKIPELSTQDISSIVAATPELMLVRQEQDEVMVLWMVLNLRMLMVNIGPPLANGAVQLGLGQERFDLIQPQVFDVLMRCARTETAAEAFAQSAEANAAAGMTKPIWTDAFGIIWALWSELPFLLAHGVAWLDAADQHYQPQAQ